MRFTFVLLLFCISIQHVQAQFVPRIRSARPGITVGVYTIGTGVFQVQAGQDFRQIRPKGSDVTTTSNNPVLVMRWGLTEHFELNGTIGWKNVANELIENKSGISNTQFGCRFNISEEDGTYKPAISIQYRLLLNLPENDLNDGYFGSKVVLAAGTKITNKMKIRANIGYTWEQAGRPRNRILFAARFPYSLRKKWGTFVDFYYDEIVASTAYTFRYNSGFSYFVNNDLKLDILAGGINTLSNSGYFLGIGFSWRTHKRTTSISE